MTKNYQRSVSLLTQCFRSNKTIASASNSNITTITTLSNTCPLSLIIETIHNIDKMVQTTDIIFDKEKGDSKRTIDIKQIEEMLVKWTHIAHFLVDTYQQIQTFNEKS
ncbi:unnamed protein product [Adineta steineri]|uniref:Uncharacterized protein n=1 Tax=Adineta steineri TaxID=433720 RepID=A0A815H4T7_9BILA|nr:unnamed protein product [Adineta steineri]CAF1173582.1 unnamed protein product [Adineta steineri]CAF1202890.1 unnamed protein product [Adineta steineri]CAF1347285.1 unnamed protein product [Adineta steineri]CAF3552376.1 unnamed protein product [Adineta steineri]